MTDTTKYLEGGIDPQGTPANGDTVVWNSTTGKPEWSPGAGITDPFVLGNFTIDGTGGNGPVELKVVDTGGIQAGTDTGKIVLYGDYGTEGGQATVRVFGPAPELDLFSADGSGGITLQSDPSIKTLYLYGVGSEPKLAIGNNGETIISTDANFHPQIEFPHLSQTLGVDPSESYLALIDPSNNGFVISTDGTRDNTNILIDGPDGVINVADPATPANQVEVNTTGVSVGNGAVAIANLATNVGTGDGPGLAFQGPIAGITILEGGASGFAKVTDGNAPGGVSGIILNSPDGTAYKINPANGGATLTITPV